MLSLLPLTFLLLLFSSPAFAQQHCDRLNNKIQVGTLQLMGDCGATQFCNAAGVCEEKHCRRDDFPFNYTDKNFPDKCGPGKFCPDEGDHCLDLQAVGQPCQLNRDDQCAPPENFKELAGELHQNFNGSICLRTTCMFQNITVGQQCIIDNTPFIAYAPGSQEFIDVVSRDNCMKDLYCDGTSLICIQKKAFAEACTGDKECASNNCGPGLICGLPPDAPKHFPTWVYAVVGISIIAGMVGTLAGLFFIHSKTRDQDRAKRLQYWREQSAFRQNILQMRETAKNSMNHFYQPEGTHSNRSSRYGIGTEDSQIPMLQTRGSPSGLRNQISDDDRDSAEESLVRGTAKRKSRKMSLPKAMMNRI